MSVEHSGIVPLLDIKFRNVKTLAPSILSLDQLQVGFSIRCERIPLIAQRAYRIRPFLELFVGQARQDDVQCLPRLQWHKRGGKLGNNVT
jgi:hypothetical protein